jgi:hypothetical protein
MKIFSELPEVIQKMIFELASQAIPKPEKMAKINEYMINFTMDKVKKITKYIPILGNIINQVIETYLCINVPIQMQSFYNTIKDKVKELEK